MQKNCPKKKTILKTCSDFYFYFPDWVSWEKMKIRGISKKFNTCSKNGVPIGVGILFFEMPPEEEPRKKIYVG
jgi:hypothetical protein